MTRTCGHTTFTPVPGCQVCQRPIKTYDEMTLGELAREWLLLRIFDTVLSN